VNALPRPPVHGTASGEAYWGPGDRYVFHVTGAESGGSMFAFDCLVGPRGGPPPHRHLAEDELFFLYEGSIEFHAADARTSRSGTLRPTGPRSRSAARRVRRVPSRTYSTHFSALVSSHSCRDSSPF
jgi:hypothetical protein